MSRLQPSGRDCLRGNVDIVASLQGVHGLWHGRWTCSVSLAEADAEQPIDHQGNWQEGEDGQEDRAAQVADEGAKYDDDGKRDDRFHGQENGQALQCRPLQKADSHCGFVVAGIISFWRDGGGNKALMGGIVDRTPTRVLQLLVVHDRTLADTLATPRFHYGRSNAAAWFLAYTCPVP
jgi:hypothetical protein